MIKAGNTPISDIYAGDKNCFIAAKGNDVIYHKDCNVFQITLHPGKTIDDVFRAVAVPTEENPYQWKREKWFIQKTSDPKAFNIFTPPGMNLALAFALNDAIKDITFVQKTPCFYEINGITQETAAVALCMCSQIENFKSEISLQGFSEITGLFSFSNTLKSVYIDAKKCDSITNLTEMFVGCTNLESVILKGFSNCHDINLSDAFKDCSSLKSLDISDFGEISLDDPGFIEGCSSLVSLKLPSVIAHGCSLRGCSSLRDITGKIADCKNGCNFYLNDAPLSRESAMIFLEAAAQFPAVYCRIYISPTTRGYLSDEDIRKATDYGWTVEVRDPETYVPNDYSWTIQILKDSEIK